MLSRRKQYSAELNNIEKACAILTEIGTHTISQVQDAGLQHMSTAFMPFVAGFEEFFTMSDEVLKDPTTSDIAKEVARYNLIDLLPSLEAMQQWDKRITEAAKKIKERMNAEKTSKTESLIQRRTFKKFNIVKEWQACASKLKDLLQKAIKASEDIDIEVPEKIKNIIDILTSISTKSFTRIHENNSIKPQIRKIEISLNTINSALSNIEAIFETLKTFFKQSKEYTNALRQQDLFADIEIKFNSVADAVIVLSKYVNVPFQLRDRLTIGNLEITPLKNLSKTFDTEISFLNRNSQNIGNMVEIIRDAINGWSNEMVSITDALYEDVIILHDLIQEVTPL
jgi:hypothetical protein